MSKPLEQALLDKGYVGVSQRKSYKPLLGLFLVTTAALMFGVVAACVKAIALPTLMLQLCRSVLEWMLGVSAALAYRRGAKFPEPQVMPESELVQNGFDPAVSGKSASLVKPDDTTQPPSDLSLLLLGPAHLRKWLVLRALLYWIFLACWWFALTRMPIGDATTIVYVGPIFTATFAYIFLGERIDWTFYPIVALDAAGLLLITQPTFLFGGSSSSSSSNSSDSSSYFLGALSALTSAIVAGLLPVCTRKSKACFWTAVNHVSSGLSALVFTPLAIAIWFKIDPTAPSAAARSLGELIGAQQLHLIPSDNVDGELRAFNLGKWLLLVGATITGFMGLAMQTLGYQLEEAARASVMTVLEIPFAYVLQDVLFHEPMTPLGLAGVSLVVSATMINLLRRLQLAK